MTSARDLIALARTAQGVTEEVRADALTSRPVVIDGPGGGPLARALAAGGDPSAVRVGGGPDGGIAYVRVLDGEPDDAAIDAFRRASRLAIPTIALQTDLTAPDGVPYVMAMNVVESEQPTADVLADALAYTLGDQAVGVAARLPSLRRPVCRRLTRNSAIATGAIGAAPWVRAAHLPLMTLLQAKLLLQIGGVYGNAAASVKDALPEGAVAITTGIGFRAVGRRLARVAPSALVGFATGFAATRMLGAAQVARYERQSEGLPAADAHDVR